MLLELGIDVPKLSRRVEHKRFYQLRGLQRGVFFDRETFGRDHLAVGYGSVPVMKLLAHSPLSAQARLDVARIEESSEDFIAGMTDADKKLQLSNISYRDYLRDFVKADSAALAMYQARSHAEWGVGIDAIAAADAWGFGYPGFKGLNLSRHSIERMGYTPAGYLDTGGSATLHFPDGNATIARLLVRRLIPAAMAGHTAEDVVTARADYTQLDRPANDVRLRLSSTAVLVRHAADAADGVEVIYLRDGKSVRVRSRSCVLACWNTMIPYLCPELPTAQKAALHELVKTPLVYTSVALRNWRAFERLKIESVYSPGCYYSEFRLNPKVDIGSYRSPTTPDEPVLIRMVRTPCQPGLSEFDQNKAGRAELLATSFATFEHNTREQLMRILGPGGFDAALDILAITVNRWPHGYAPEYNPLYDPDVPEAERANVIARRPHGRIAIANSDAGAAAYTDSAIDQARRAVDELLSG
jgi:spermidine dehydrogenase